MDEIITILAIYGAVVSTIMGIIKLYEIRQANKKYNQEKVGEKSKQIYNVLIVPLSKKADEVIEKFRSKTFLKQESISENLSLTVFVQQFENIIDDSKIILISNNQYSLVYRKDPFLKKHFKGIAHSLFVYKINLQIISSVLNEIKILPIPDSMEPFIAGLCTDINHNIGDINHNPKQENFKRIIVSYVLNNPKIYTSGNSVVMELLKKKNSEISQFLDQIDRISDLKKRFQIAEEKVLSSAIDLKDELDMLSIEWQDEYNT